jgi:hypothetical protein
MRGTPPPPPQLFERRIFAERAMERSGGLCVLCRKEGLAVPATEVHHAMERRLFREPHELGGYMDANAIPVCNPHHRLCEQTVVSVEEACEAAAIAKPVLPSHLYPDSRYDKWGNAILPNGMRLKGELFHDESVQRVLAEGGVLPLFTHLVRFPRTSHVPWSPGATSDDRLMRDMSAFEGRRVVASVKRDGQNNTVYPTGELHARSPDAPAHADQAMARAEAARWQFDIPDDWRVVCENLWRTHSIAYDDLPSFLLGIHVWNDRNVCLGWDETLEWFELLGVNPVETIYDGIFDERLLRSIEFDRDRMEGWVVRVADPIPYGDYGRLVGKFVRQGHNHLHGSRHAAIVTNELGPSGGPAWRFATR